MIFLLLSFLVSFITTNVVFTKNSFLFVSAKPNSTYKGCKIRPTLGDIPDSWVGSAGNSKSKKSSKTKSGKSKNGSSKAKKTKGRKKSLDMSDFDITKCFIAQEQERQKSGKSKSSKTGKGKKDKFEGTSVIEIQFFDDGPLEQFALEQDTKTPRAYRGKHLIRQDSTDNPSAQGNTNDVAASLNMVMNEASGYMAGSCQMNGKLYLFGSLEGDGRYSVTEVSLEDLPSDFDGNVSSTSTLGDGRNKKRTLIRGNHDYDDNSKERNYDDASSVDNNGYNRTLKAAAAKAASNAASRLIDQSPIVEGTGEEWIIDVIVPYTQRVLCAITEAYHSSRCVANDRRKELVEARIQLAIQESNVALENSGIPGRVRLIHSFMVPNSRYDEQVDGLTYDVILSHAAGLSTDGVDSLAYFQTIRERHGADVVSFWVDNQSSCGWAYTGTPVEREKGYSVVNWLCATGYFSFIHEIGHLLGGRHDRNVEECNLTPQSCCPPKGGCNRYAYQDPFGRFRSIMAYNCPNSLDGRCPRVQYFSQPTYELPVIDTEGNEFTLPLGDAWNNNALAPNGIFDTFQEVANFYESSVAAFNKYCGNGICEPNYNENCRTCPADCVGGTRAAEVCGNKICEVGENCYNCPSDCAQRIDIYNDDFKYCCVGGPTTSESLVGIAYGKSCDTFTPCGYGFLGCSTQPKQNDISVCCGNGICEAPGEGVWNCPADCSCVNDGICDTSFEDNTCLDCPTSFAMSSTGQCLSNHRICNGMQPDPCCGRCNESTRRCVGAP